MQTNTLAACPICDSNLAPLGITENYELAALGGHIVVDYVICEACAFVCQANVLPLESLMRYYEDSPKLRVAQPSDTHRTLYIAQAQFMERAGRLNGTRVLDIGADMGKLLDHLLAQYNCTTFYEEENRTASEWLKSVNRHRDARCEPQARFDWIVLSQVLEHIVDPVAILQTLRGRLGDEGKVFIEVPNHGIWDDLDVGFFFEHVNYFSPASLSAALDRAGYNLIRLEVTNDAHYFEGRCRIIRACAQPRHSRLIADAATFVREHELRHRRERLGAVKALAGEVSGEGRGGLALYGAAELATSVLRAMSYSDVRVVALFDSDARKHGSDFAGLAVRPPSDIKTVAPDAVLILSSAEADIRKTIESTGYVGRIVCWSTLSGD